MSATRYDEYAKDVSGWFLGMTGTQLGLLTTAGLPALLALSVRAWGVLALWLPLWGLVAIVVLMPIRGRPAGRWLLHLCHHALGVARGETDFGSRAIAGTAPDLEEADLPGVLAGVQTHDGPPFGHLWSRPALVQNSATRTWAVTARVTHPGIGLSDPDERDQMATGLAQLCELVPRIEMVEVLALQVRTVPDDGAERSVWEQTHRRREAPALAVQVNTVLSQALTAAAVRTEAFVTVVVSEGRIGRAARHAGGGVDGRGRVLHGVMAEVESTLRGAVGCTAVEWLDSPALAAAIRTGFAPGERYGLVAAELARGESKQIATSVPMAAAGPTRAKTEIRHYVHDAWASVTDTILLPEQGAVLGALAPVLIPTAAGERRSMTLFLQPMPTTRATRLVGREHMSAATGTELRSRMGFRTRPRERRNAERIGDADEKLAVGRALVRLAAAACVTVPAIWPVEEHGRRLESSIRGAGFVPLRLDLAQDSGFAAAAVPLGIGLPDRRARW